MTSMLETAFETAIAIETRSLLFYRAVLSKVKDHKTRQIFELLAQEEANHLESFCSLYRGSEDDLVSSLCNNYAKMAADPLYNLLHNSIDVHASEIEALRVAIKEEQACIDKYTVFVETIREPLIRDVFAHALEETHRHLAMISEDYRRHLSMEERSVQNFAEPELLLQ